MVVMKKIYLINFSLCEKIGDKKNGTVEDAASFITCTEFFFIFLSIEFIFISLLPVKISPYILGGIGIVTWYYTNYVMRKKLKDTIVNFKIRQLYRSLDKRVTRKYFILSIILFFAITVFTLQGYYK